MSSFESTLSDCGGDNPNPSGLSIYEVFAQASITVMMTGLGAVPFLFIKHLSTFSQGIATTSAAGMMTGAAIVLANEAWEIGNSVSCFTSMVIGAFFVYLVSRYFEVTDVSFEDINGADANRICLVIWSMTIHSFAEGVSIGVALSHTQRHSLATTVIFCLGLHNIPEGLMVSLVLITRGVPVGRSALWSIFSSIGQPIMAVPAFLFVNVFSSWLPYGLGFAGGAMLWVVISELIPEAKEKHLSNSTICVVFAGTSVMIFQLTS